MIDAVCDFYGRINANVHRGVHRLSQEATDAFEKSRDLVARRLDGLSREELLDSSNQLALLTKQAIGIPHVLQIALGHLVRPARLCQINLTIPFKRLPHLKA